MSLIHEFRRTGETTRILPESTGTKDARIVGSYTDGEDITGGFESASCVISAVEYAAHIALYQIGTTWLVKSSVSGKYIWAGEINDPEPQSDGTYQISADGWGVTSDFSSSHFLIMSYDLSSWIAGDQDPLSYSMADKYEIKVGARRFLFKVKNHTSFRRGPLGNPAEWWAGFFKYVPGVNIKYVAFNISKSKNDSDYRIQVVGAVGPDGPLNVIATYGLDGAGPSSVSLAIPDGYDLVGIRISRLSTAKKAPPRQFTVSNVRIGALATSDSFTLNQAMTSLLNLMGASSVDVAASSVSAIPYEADSGTYGQMADEIAMLDNWFWRWNIDTSGNKVGYAGPFGRKQWNLVRPNSPVTLLPQRRYTHVQIPYIGEGGVPASKIIAASPNTLPVGFTRVFPIQMDDPPHEAVATLFGQAIVNYLNTMRHSGGGSFSHVTDPVSSLEVHGSEVHPGDQLILVNRNNEVVTVSTISHDESGNVTSAQFSDSQPLLEKLLTRRIRLLNKGFGPDRSAFEVLGLDDPMAPTNVVVEYLIRELNQRLHFRGIVTYDEVLYDIVGNGTAIDHYDVRMRPVNEFGQWLNENGTLATANKPGYMLRHVVHTRLDTDNPNELDTKTVFEDLQHPKSWYWQASIRATDIAGNESTWSPWTAPTLPNTQADPKPPAPGGLVQTFDTNEKDRWERIQAICRFNEVTNFSYPGDPDGPQDDVLQYGIRMQISRDGVNPIAERKGHKLAKDEDADTFTTFRFYNIKKMYFYRFSVRSSDRWNRKGDWSPWTAWATPNDNNPPPAPVAVTAYPDKDAVECDWRDPHWVNDPELVDPDVAYYQAQVSNVMNFASILKSWDMLTHTRVRYLTDFYKRRYWFRIRSVDSSGNKSGWIVTRGVRPSKVRVARREPVGSLAVPAQVDWETNQGILAAGAQTNSAYHSVDANPAVAYVDGEEASGTVEVEVTTSSVADRTYAGASLRVFDNDDFYFAAIVDIAATNGVVLGKSVAGTITILDTYTTIPIEVETTYALKIEVGVQNPDQFVVSLNGNVIITRSSLTDHNDSNNFGLFSRRASGFDNGESRFHRFRYTPISSTLGFVVDDEFDREALDAPGAVDAVGTTIGSYEAGVGSAGIGGSASVIAVVPAVALGVAESGQAWLGSGTWSIEPSENPFALYGAAIEIPVFHLEDTTVRSGEVIAPVGGGNPTSFGLTGKNTAGRFILLDRPTRLIAWAFSDISNESPSVACNYRFYVIFDDGIAPRSGRQTNNYSSVSDPGQRLLATSHEEFFDASPDNPLLIEVTWGYRNDSGANRNATVRNQKCTFMAVYAPDFHPTFNTKKRPVWTKHGKTRAAYRVQEGSDV